MIAQPFAEGALSLAESDLFQHYPQMLEQAMIHFGV